MKLFSQLSFEVLRDELGVEVRSGQFLPAVAPLPLPPWFQEYRQLHPWLPAAYKSKKAISEILVAPLLTVLKAHEEGQLAIFSGEALAGAGLMGTGDFVISFNPAGFYPENPGLLITTAGKQSLFNGLLPCIGAMLAARADPALCTGAGRPVVYGCVTTGDLWQFLQLTGSEVTVDSTVFYPADLERVLGTLAWVLAQLR